MDTHEYVVELQLELVQNFPRGAISWTYLLIPNGELALCLLVGLGKRLELLDGLGPRDLHAELHICLGVFMARLEKLALLMGDGKQHCGQRT